MIAVCDVNCAQVASATHDRQHADKVLNEYVTTTITTVMSAFFGSQFSEQSTAVKVTSDAVNSAHYVVLYTLV